MSTSLRVLVWNEFQHEKTRPAVREIYPQGIHEAIAEGLRADSTLQVETATLEQPEHGLSAERLQKTDVLLWWGHMAHDQVEETVVDRVQKRVLEGMGLIVLHSGHFSKIFIRMMGTSCALTWREAGERERVWVVSPGHPIAEGIGDYIELEHSEMYGEPFIIAPPEELVFVSWFQGGEIFRGGCCWRRGNGRIFYFSPGHETYPIYRQAQIQRVLRNAVHWAAPGRGQPPQVPRKVPVEQAREKLPAAPPR